MVPAPHPTPSESQSSDVQLNPEGFSGTGGQSLRGPGIRDQPLPEERGMGKLSQDGSQASEKEGPPQYLGTWSSFSMGWVKQGSYGSAGDTEIKYEDHAGQSLALCSLQQLAGSQGYFCLLSPLCSQCQPIRKLVPLGATYCPSFSPPLYTLCHTLTALISHSCHACTLSFSHHCHFETP